MSDEQLGSHLYLVFKTLREMLDDRGYLVPPSELEMTEEQFKEKYGEIPSRESLTSMHRQKNDPTDLIFIFFAEVEKLGVKELNVYKDRMNQQGVNRAIVVYQKSITSFAKQSLQAFKVTIELFREDDLLVNITKHKLVPKHIVLTNEEKKALLKKYNLNESQLPRIQKDDPVARYFGLKRLTVVKIIRDSETAGRYVTYRIVW